MMFPDQFCMPLGCQAIKRRVGRPHTHIHIKTLTVFSPDPVLFPYFTMKVLAIALALTAVLATVSAECPNACSGHGDCTLCCSSCEAAHHGAVC